jgi:hypothetical protein
MRRNLVFVFACLTAALGLALFAQPVAAQEDIEDPTISPTIPFLEQWQSSAHAAFDTEAFRHWDGDDPAEVPASCAKCHSSAGYQDFLGVDGSEAGVVNSPAPVNTVVDCVACHNSVTAVKDSVVMPSGIELTGLGGEARCMECHQGRESKVSVDAAIANAAVDDDAVSEDLGFRNIHYYAAAATKYGTLAQGGYEYEGNTYDADFQHVEGYETCVGCHSPHTLEVKIEACAECHAGVETVEDLRDVRMAGSEVDYDGDGDVDEGIYYEIAGLQEALFQSLQTYAADVAGAPIAYDSHNYPYFVGDLNGNGEVDEDEVGGGNAYRSWTPRLLRAAYNYQVSVKDPGQYAHGGKYIIQLLHDSIADLNEALAAPVDMTAARRIDAGHFAGSEEAFRHWDAEGVVPGSCAKCHTGTGLPMFLAEGVTISQQPTDGLQCATCHNDLQEFTLHEVASVTFPSGAVIDSGDPESNLCLNCHQGRESTVSVNRLIGDTPDDETSESLRFLNVHYFAAGATRFGTEAKGAYEYAGKEYAGFFNHSRMANQCNDCHGTHSLEVDYVLCADCHDDIEINSAEDLANIRYYFDDWDGDGDADEGLAGEVDTLIETLYAVMQAYATSQAGVGIVYDSHAYPYFFNDTNGNGVADPEELQRTNGFNSWTPRLLRGAYNYQYASKDPGAYAHNGPYIIQTLQDSIEDLGGDVSGMIRP